MSCLGGKFGGLDSCIRSGVLDVIEFGMNHLQATVLCSYAHNVPELPFGPLAVNCHHMPPEASATLRGLATKLHFLAPSHCLCSYIERWGGGAAAALATPADFDYFGSSLPEPHDLFDGHHKYVTIISPCPAKGTYYALLTLLLTTHFSLLATY